MESFIESIFIIFEEFFIESNVGMFTFEELFIQFVGFIPIFVCVLIPLLVLRKLINIFV